MSLSTEANVTQNVRRIINNGFHSHHPFRTELDDYVRIFAEVRRLPHDDFLLCLKAIKEVVDLQQQRCTGCYGKGLAYVRLLAQGISEDEHLKAREKYTEFINLRNWSRDFEGEILQELNRQGIKI